MKKSKTQFVIGLLFALSSAYMMFDGSVLGDNTIGYASVVGIIGLGLIAASKYRILK